MDFSKFNTVCVWRPGPVVGIQQGVFKSNLQRKKHFGDGIRIIISIFHLSLAKWDDG